MESGKSASPHCTSDSQIILPSFDSVPQNVAEETLKSQRAEG